VSDTVADILEKGLNENRRFTRVRYSIIINCTRFCEDNNEMLADCTSTFELLDISLAGTSFMNSEPIDLGTCFKFDLEIENTHNDVVAHVVYCRKEGDLFKIGMEFIKPKPRFLERIKKLVMKLS